MGVRKYHPRFYTKTEGFYQPWWDLSYKKYYKRCIQILICFFFITRFLWTFPPLNYFSEKDVCKRWMSCNKDTISSYLKHAALPSCPCLYPLHLSYNPKVWDPHAKKHYNWMDVDAKTEGLYAYKPSAKFCIRSKLFKGVPTLASQMCCYDNDFKLITRGKGAGTPNLISPEMSPELHHKLDINPWIICKGDWSRYEFMLKFICCYIGRWGYLALQEKIS